MAASTALRGQVTKDGGRAVQAGRHQRGAGVLRVGSQKQHSLSSAGRSLSGAGRGCRTPPSVYPRGPRPPAASLRPGLHRGCPSACREAGPAFSRPPLLSPRRWRHQSLEEFRRFRKESRNGDCLAGPLGHAANNTRCVLPGCRAGNRAGGDPWLCHTWETRLCRGPSSRLWPAWVCHRPSCTVPSSHPWLEGSVAGKTCC